MNIKVLGTGCAHCRTLEKAVKKAVEELSVNASVEKEEDIRNIMKYGILRTPGLVIDERVVLSGRVPSVGELKEIIQKNMNQ
jgi:small redox-active disulfide protein 2